MFERMKCLLANIHYLPDGAKDGCYPHYIFIEIEVLHKHYSIETICYTNNHTKLYR